MSATLANMAAVISTELGLYDDTSIALIKGYLSINYVNIWDKYPWIDTELSVVVTLPNGTAAIPLGTDTFLATRYVDRVIAIRARNIMEGEADTPTFRADARMLEPVTTKFLIESAPQIFELGGYVKYYEEATNPINGDKFIRFYPTPVTDVEIVIVAKAICPGFSSDDTATAIIRNIDQALLAYATSDMLKRQRQYGKADFRRKEAQELEAVAWNLEQQQANQPRMTKRTTAAGNSLEEMTDAVCTICGQWTPEYRLVITEFLRRNYQALYDSYLWPESMVGVRVPYTQGNVVMPEYIDRVIAVRGNSNARMFPVDAGLIMDITPEAFSEFGDPVSYVTVTPVGVATLPLTTTKLVIASTSPVDTSNVMLRGEVYVTGTQVEEYVTLNGTTPVTSSWSYDVPLTVAKDITIGFVTVNAQSDSRLLVQLLPYQRESKHQRLAFLPLPNPDLLATGQSYHCLVLGKRTIRPLLIDEDTPIITGVQQVLIAGAAADLFRKLGQADQAAAFQQKAGASAEVLKAKNLDQAASSPRFVPQIEPRAYVAGGVGGCAW